MLDQAGYKAEQTSIDQLLGLIYALLGLAILIALLGIANTLALSILERTRELGLLRAVGMTRSQLRSTIRWESVIIALQGTLLGLVIGLFFGWALVRRCRTRASTRSASRCYPRGHRRAGGAGRRGRRRVPARRAAKLDVLRAVVTE